METFLAILPLAVVMSAGPQIVTAVFLATSRQPHRNSLAFLAGVATATTIGVTAFFFLGNAISPERSADERTWLDWVIVALLVVLAIRVFMTREEAEPPKWMGRLETADAGFSAKIGLLLYLVMPTDIICMATVGTYLAREEAPWWHSLSFLALTVLIAGIPFILLLILRRRADTLLPSIRTWMNTNAWVVSEAVLVFFIVVTLAG